MQKSLLSKTLFLIWSTFCLVLFIYIPSRIDFIHGFSINNFPLTVQKLERINLVGLTQGMMGSLITVMLLSLAYISLGSCFLHRIAHKNLAEKKLTLPVWLALIGTSFLIGHLFFSIAFICLAALQKFTSFYVFSTLTIGFVTGFPSLRDIVFGFWVTKRSNIIDEVNGAGSKIFLYFSIGLLFLGLLYSSSRLSYDAAAIYLSDEKLVALTNRIQYFQNDSFVASSFQAGISYAALIIIFGDQAARVYSWVNGIVILMFTLAIGEKVGVSKQVRLLTVLLLLTSTAFLDLTGDGKIDLISTASAVAAVYWTIGSTVQKSTSTSLLIGVLTGLAIASRPFNVFLVTLFIGVYYSIRIYSQKGREISNISQSVLWIGIGATCMVVSHLFINWIILGDPIAILKDIQRVNSSNWQWTFDRNALELFRLFYPISISIINLPQSNGNITPSFVAFLPGLLIKEVREKIVVSKVFIEVLIAAIVTLTIWIAFLFMIFEIRYVLFLWVILFMGLATVIEGFFTNKDIYLKRFVEFTMVIVFVFTSSRAVYIWMVTYSPVDELGNPHCYDYNLCRLLEPINKTAAPGDRVLILNAFRYYLRSDLLMCSSKHEEYRILQNLSQNDSNIFWEEVYRQGYKYITLETLYSDRHLGLSFIPSPANTPDWLELRPIYGKPGEELVSYQIYVKNPPQQITKACNQNAAGVWEVTDTKPQK